MLGLGRISYGRAARDRFSESVLLARELRQFDHHVLLVGGLKDLAWFQAAGLAPVVACGMFTPAAHCSEDYLRNLRQLCTSCGYLRVFAFDFMFSISSFFGLLP